jgi:hypothetical protein
VRSLSADGRVMTVAATTKGEPGRRPDGRASGGDEAKTRKVYIKQDR